MEFTRNTVTVGLRYNGRLYMSQRIKVKNFVDKWQFAGGKVELDEHPVYGALREVLEETGLNIAIERLHYLMPITDDPTCDVCHAFIVELEQGEIPKKMEDTTSEWVLLTYDEALAKDLMPGLKLIINGLKHGIKA